MVTPDEAAQVCQVSSRTIYRRIESGRLHFSETERGFALICLQSLGSDRIATATSEEGVVPAYSRRFLGNGFVKRMLRRR